MRKVICLIISLMLIVTMTATAFADKENKSPDKGGVMIDFGDDFIGVSSPEKPPVGIFVSEPDPEAEFVVIHPEPPKPPIDEPVQPVYPVEPVILVQPVQPIYPVEPIHPEIPIEPVQPIIPVTPVSPVTPVYVIEPITPIIPFFEFHWPLIPFGFGDLIAFPKVEPN